MCVHYNSGKYCAMLGDNIVNLETTYQKQVPAEELDFERGWWCWFCLFPKSGALGNLFLRSQLPADWCQITNRFKNANFFLLSISQTYDQTMSAFSQFSWIKKTLLITGSKLPITARYTVNSWKNWLIFTNNFRPFMILNDSNLSTNFIFLHLYYYLFYLLDCVVFQKALTIMSV